MDPDFRRGDVLQVRWLGRVPFDEALALQTNMFENRAFDHALFLEHPHVFTMGVRAKSEHLLVDPAEIGADIVNVNRGGDVTYHGPGQLIGYFVQNVGDKSGLTETAKYVHNLEQIVIDALDALGLPGAHRERGMPGVWIRDRKIAAVGVRITRGRTMHGFALNVDTDLSWFDKIVPCGLDKSVTSLRNENIDVTMQETVDAIVQQLEQRTFDDDFGKWNSIERYDVAWKVKSTDLSAFTRGEGPGQLVTPETPKRDSRKQPVRLLGRLAQAGVDTNASVEDNARKPEWMKVRANFGPEYTRLKNTMRSLDLVTVCEEAGCPNIFDCWNDGTATFMINGERCTRACGFCLVDTRKPLPLDADEPARVADAVQKMKLQHVVITVVARDDLADGGAGAVADTIHAIRERSPESAIETLISDCKGHARSLQLIFDAAPDVLNHNLETVARLQRAVRPSAAYSRSLGVLARAKQANLATKSGLIVGLGETPDEVVGAMIDLRSVGVDILTIGQYLRPTTNHMPISRWWTPQEFDDLRVIGEELGFAHVESSPLTRSSYHAKQGAAAAGAKS